MDPQPDFSFKQLFSHLIGDMAKAVSLRGDESQPLKLGRTQAAVHMIMGFLPRDTIEAMFAGHTVMFHELLVDAFRFALMGEADTARRGSRASIIAIDKAFRLNLDRLEHYRLRPADGRRDETAAPLASPVQLTPEPPAANPIVVETELPATPSAAAIAACHANPEAMAALEAGDPVRFARALGVAEPNEAFLAAAKAPGSPFDRKRPFVATPAYHSGNGKADPTQAEVQSSVNG
jgi:hypothetical protein